LIANRSTKGIRIRLERLFAKDVQRVISNWYKDIAKKATRRGIFGIAIRDAARHRYLTKEELIKHSNVVLRVLFDGLEKEYLDSTQRRLIQRYYRLWYRRLFELGAVDALRLMGFKAESKLLDQFIKRKEVSKAEEEGIAFELTTNEIINDLNSRAVRFGAGITAEVIKDARRLVRDNIYLGDLGSFEVGRLISRTSSIPMWRGVKIARTESQVAYNTAVFEEFRRSGVKQHFWINVGDGRVREWHVVNGLVGPVPIGEPFPSGQIQPGEGVPELVVHCRCSLQPDLSDPNLVMAPWDGGDTLYVQETGIRHFPKFLGDKKGIVISRLRDAIKSESIKRHKDVRVLDLLRDILESVLDGSIAEL